MLPEVCSNQAFDFSCTLAVPILHLGAGWTCTPAASYLLSGARASFDWGLLFTLAVPYRHCVPPASKLLLHYSRMKQEHHSNML